MTLSPIPPPPPVDLPRRAVLRTAVTGFGLSVVGSAMAAPKKGAAQAGASCATILELADMEPDLAIVDVRGLLVDGDGGGGLFVWRYAQIGRLRSDGAVSIASRIADDGAWHRAAYDGTRVSPNWFGALDETSDHAPVIQKAIEYVAGEGGGTVDLGQRRYRCLSAIELDPILCILSGEGAILDASEREDVESDPALGAVSFDELRGIGAWPSDEGRLRGSVGTDLVVNLRLTAGERFRVDLVLDEVGGDPNGSYFRVSVFDGEATKPHLRRTFSAPGREIFEFDWVGRDGARLVLSTNAAAAISAFAISPYGRRETLRVRSRPESRQYGHTWLQGIRLLGPGATGRGTSLEGIRFETETDGFSSRLSVRDVMVEGFGTAIVLSDRAYLVQFSQCRLASDIGVHFLGGARDAGENIVFLGCTIDGGRIGILNGGGEFNLFGTSLDFCEQFYVGRGTVLASGCHFETDRTERPDQYLFDLSDGRFAVEGGTILVSGRDFEIGNQARHVVMTRSRLARLTMRGTFCYNLRSATGVFAGGPGTVRLDDLAGDSARHVAPIVQRDLASNLFGPASRLDREPMGLLVKLLDASLVGSEDLGTVRRVLAEGTEPETGYLEATKSGEADTPLCLWLLAPARAGMRVGWTIEARLERAAGSRDPGDLSLDLLFVQLIGDGAATIGGFVEAKRPVPVSGADLTDWHEIVGTTLNTREDDWSDGTAPAFATHIALRFDLTPLGPGDRLFLRAPFAGAV